MALNGMDGIPIKVDSLISRWSALSEVMVCATNTLNTFDFNFFYNNLLFIELVLF
jgi:hypothetical protein